MRFAWNCHSIYCGKKLLKIVVYAALLNLETDLKSAIKVVTLLLRPYMYI